MEKKLDIDNTVKKAEDITNKVNVIMRNKLIIAIFLIVDGLMFIVNQNKSLVDMARNIILIVLFASFSTLITNIASKTKDLKSIIISIFITVIVVILYIYPDLISAYMQIVFAVIIILDGVINIFNALNMNKLSKYTQGIAEKFDSFINKEKSNKDVYKGMEEQKEKLINPLKKMVGKTNKASIPYIIANIASVILGVILIVYPNISMVIWGIVFIYTGISDLLVAMKTMNISKKIKEKKFKEIIYEEDKKSKNEGKKEV